MKSNPKAISASDKTLNEVLMYKNKAKNICSKVQYKKWEESTFFPWLNGPKKPVTAISKTPPTKKNKCEIETLDNFSGEEILILAGKTKNSNITAIMRLATGEYLNMRARLAAAGMGRQLAESEDSIKIRMIKAAGYKEYCGQLSL